MTFHTGNIDDPHMSRLRSLEVVDPLDRFSLELVYIYSTPARIGISAYHQTMTKKSLPTLLPHL